MYKGIYFLPVEECSSSGFQLTCEGMWQVALSNFALLSLPLGTLLFLEALIGPDDFGVVGCIFLHNSHSPSSPPHPPTPWLPGFHLTFFIILTSLLASYFARFPAHAQHSKPESWGTPRRLLRKELYTGSPRLATVRLATVRSSGGTEKSDWWGGCEIKSSHPARPKPRPPYLLVTCS